MYAYISWLYLYLVHKVVLPINRPDRTHLLYLQAHIKEVSATKRDAIVIRYVGFLSISVNKRG